MEISRVGTGPGTWDYSRGIVWRKTDRKVIADIKRNFGHFPFTWMSQEGSEYLVCGEDYQGHSVVDLGKGVTHVFVHEGAEKGGGFCWRELRPSPDGSRLLVEGCYWDSDFEWRVYDFAHPPTGPFPVIAYLSFLRGDPYDDALGPSDARWLDDSRVMLDQTDVVDLRDPSFGLSGPELAQRYPRIAGLFETE